MRRSAALLPLLAALAVSASAAAGLEPVQRSAGALTLDRVREGLVTVPPKALRGRTRVIVTLGLPPLAAASEAVRTTQGFAGARRLNLRAASSRAYLARIDAAQRRAIATLRRAIPQSRVQERYRVILDGFTVDLPTSRLPALYRLGFVEKVYPSLRYSMSLNRSPAIIGAPQLAAATGANGAGIKVAVVDDGVDQTNPFLDSAGYSYPAGFPKGDSGFTTPKVIVARNFPGRTATPGGRVPVDRDQSFHATFVAGVIAGNAGTTAPASTEGDCRVGGGRCHPAVSGLSGVAPRAWIGNYRVFNVPSPLGGCCQGNTPEIAAAFEAAVNDGMDVINFSGGGPQSDPATDALIEAVENVAKAGVVPVISAGNDRDLFGLGTVGSPSTAPAAISVAAVSNEHVFGRALTLVSPDAGLGPIEIAPNQGGIPQAWTTGRPIVDVGTVAAAGDRRLCGPVPAGSLQGVVALATKGGCSFESKAARASAAGANGIVLVEDVGGDPSGVQIGLGIPGGSVSDLDGARLREALARSGGRGTIRVGGDEVEIVTNRGDVPASFSSAGPTAFGHLLKPDLAAPGAQIVSSTLIEYAASGFAVLDGTSFSAPHISGAVALLLQRHPSWTPMEVKSALMSTAGPVFGDSARTREAPVYVEGAGLARLPVADNPAIFTEPQSLSLRVLNISGGAASQSLLVTLTDAGGGAGTWQLALQPQSATTGSSVDIGSSSVAIAPGGQGTFEVAARAAAGAATGDDYGFVVLTRGGDTRRIPYFFSVVRPQLAGAEVLPLKRVQSGTTLVGTDRAQLYRWPTTPFGATELFGVDQPVAEDGKEKVYAVDVPQRRVNFGVVVISPRANVGAPTESLLDANAPIRPWVLGSLDESDVQGYAATPVNTNSLMPDFLFADGAAGAVFAQPGRYYVVVDSGHDPFTGRALGGRYVLRSWTNDVKPPRVRLITTRVWAGRPTVVARITDTGAGVNALSLLLDTKQRQIGATLFDPATGIAVFPIPKDASPLQPGSSFMRVIGSDYQEAKNVNVTGESLLPNTAFENIALQVVRGPAVTWIAPEARACAARRTGLAVVAGSNSLVSSVIFYDGARRIARVKKNVYGIYRATWNTAGAGKGAHTLTAIVADVSGRERQATRVVRICG